MSVVFAFQFPVDVQDLTVSITSNHHSDTIRLVQDDDRFSIINREAFFDQQEWTLYEHVATEMRETKEEYSFQQDTGIEPKMHPVLAITCRAGFFLSTSIIKFITRLIFSSTRTWLLLLEWILSDFSYHFKCFLHFFYSTKVGFYLVRLI